MKYLLMTMLFLSSFVAPVFGSEKKRELYNFTVYVRDNEPLVSCDEKYVDSFNKTCGTQCTHKEPFLPVYYEAHEIGKLPVFLVTVVDSSERPQDWIQVKENVIKPIKFIPFRSFFDWRGFKKAHDTILYFSKKDENPEKFFHIKMASQLIYNNNDNPKILLDKFENNTSKVGQDSIINKS